MRVANMNDAINDHRQHDQQSQDQMGQEHVLVEVILGEVSPDSHSEIVMVER